MFKYFCPLREYVISNMVKSQDLQPIYQIFTLCQIIYCQGISSEFRERLVNMGSLLLGKWDANE